MTDGTDDLPDNKLFELYERYIGEPDAQTDVYLGFGLFFVAIAFAVIGFVLFLWAGLYEAGSDPYWARRMLAFALGMLSIPSAMLSVVVLLPVEKRATYTAAGGMAVCLVAVLVFISVYPGNWNVQSSTDYSTQTTAIYALGMTVITASTGAALVAHQLAQAKPHPSEIEPMEEDDPEESYSDEEIEQDIEAAMDGVEMSWGGVEKHESTRLTFSSPDAFESANVDVEAETTRQSGGVDAQVSGLKALKGGDTKTATSSSTVDDQTSKLNELKQRRQEEEAGGDDSGFLDSLGVVERIRETLKRN